MPNTDIPEKRWIWVPDDEQIRKTNVYRFMTALGCRTREEFLHFSRENPEIFWDRLARETGIEWFHPYHQVLDTTRGVEWAEWFLGGKLNIAWNCLDRHARGPAAGRTAVIWEAEDGATRTITFAELERDVNRLAHALDALGLERGDRVALYMPMIPEVVVIFYACLKIGLTVVPVFSGFGPAALATRLQDSGARLVFTADAGERRGRRIPLKPKVDEALATNPEVQWVVICQYKGGDHSWNSGRDLWWHALLEGRPAEHDCAVLDAAERAFILYTSGTTGRPKGAVHTHSGCLVQMSKEIYLAFDHQPGDRFFWVSDIGWMMGPWTLIGNHNFGGTVFLYDGAPDHPAPDRFWSIIERHRITTFGISPTAIRLLLRRDPDGPSRYDLSSLRILGSTGEPWDETSYLWYFEKTGKRRLPIINISGGTEIVGSFVLPLPIQPLKACSVGAPSPGIPTEIFDERGHPVRGRMGYLVCTGPVPSMTRGLWNAPARYLETYWSRWKGVWDHGDWASVDEDGCWFLYGRADEAFNVAGRKVGPAEIEQVLIDHPAVSEAAVIGVPDELTGEAIVAFVVLNQGADGIGSGPADEICGHVGHALGRTLVPRALYFVPELPKTQSGKIVRRALRRTYLGEEAGDLSTIENPAALQSCRTVMGRV